MLPPTSAQLSFVLIALAEERLRYLSDRCKHTMGRHGLVPLQEDAGHAED